MSIIRIILPLLAGALLCGCSSRLVDAETFSQVPLGATPEEVEQTLGSPDETRKTPEGDIEYVYIERITIDEEDREQVHYHIRFSDGKAIEKEVEELDPPPPIFFFTE